MVNTLEDAYKMSKEDINDSPSSSNKGMTFFMGQADKQKNPEIIKALIERGADINLGDNLGQNALHHAAWNNPNPEIMEVLLSSDDADIDAGCIDGTSPLWYACQNNPDVIHVLMKHGATISEEIKEKILSDDVKFRSIVLVMLSQLLNKNN